MSRNQLYRVSMFDRHPVGGYNIHSKEATQLNEGTWEPPAGWRAVSYQFVGDDVVFLLESVDPETYRGLVRKSVANQRRG